MKNLLKLLALFLLVGLFSCSDDDDAGNAVDCSNFTEVIIGTWECDACGAGEATFQADGTLLDPSGLLISGEINGNSFDEKKWSSDGSNLTVRAESATGIEFVEAELAIINTSCDVITLILLDTDFDLERVN